MRIVYITTETSEAAKNISKRLLEKRLIACANIFPIESMYWWKGKVTEGFEFVILCKAPDDNYEEIEKEVKAIHEEEVPAIYSWKVDKVSKDYEDWLKRETKRK